MAAIGKAGILPDVSAEKLLTIAKIAYEEFDSDLQTTLKKPLPEATKALKRFPSIGDPGAEKILLFTRSYPVMALDSDGVRVLCRVGFADEQRSAWTNQVLTTLVSLRKKLDAGGHGKHYLQTEPWVIYRFDPTASSAYEYRDCQGTARASER